MKKNIWKLIIIAFVAIIIVIFIGRQKINNISINNEPIKIGSISILTGDGASWGEAAVNGIEMAIGEINATGGILERKLVHISEDDAGDPAKAVSAFRKLTTINRVDYIVGPTWSKQGLAIMDLVNDEIIISPSLGKAEFNESSDYVFNTWMHDYILSEELAHYVYEKGYRNIAILGANDVWVKEQTNAVRETFTELGGTISYVYEPTTDIRDLRTALLKMKNKNIDAIVVTTDGYGITALYGKQMAELGIEKSVYAITLDETVIGNCMGTCDGWEYVTALTPSDEFIKRYKNKYNRNVEIGADTAYDAVMMIAEAMEKTKSTDTEKIQKYLNNIEIYRGQSGNLVSDGKGAFTKDYKTFTIEGGKSVEILK